MPGRKYYGDGELFAYDVFSSTFRAERPDGRALFTEKFLVEPARATSGRLGVMGDFDVFGNVMLLTPPEHADAILRQVPATVYERTRVGASRLPNDAGPGLQGAGHRVRAGRGGRPRLLVTPVVRRGRADRLA